MLKLTILLSLLSSSALAYPCSFSDSKEVCDTKLQMEDLENRQRDLENKYRQDKLEREIKCIQDGGWC